MTRFETVRFCPIGAAAVETAGAVCGREHWINQGSSRFSSMNSIVFRMSWSSGCSSSVEVGRPAHRDRAPAGVSRSVVLTAAPRPRLPRLEPRAPARDGPGIVDDIPVQVVAVLNVELPETRRLEAGSAQNLGERDLLPVGKVLVGQDSGGPTGSGQAAATCARGRTVDSGSTSSRRRRRTRPICRGPV